MRLAPPDHDPADIYVPGPANRPVAVDPHGWVVQCKREPDEVRWRRIEAGMGEPAPGDGARIPAGDVAATAEGQGSQ